MMIKRVIPEHCPITDEGLQYYLDSMPTVRSRRAMLEFVRLNPRHGKPEASVHFMERIRSGLPRLNLPVTSLKATFGPGHHFLAEERPERVVELVTETIREHASAAGRTAV